MTHKTRVSKLTQIRKGYQFSPPQIGFPVFSFRPVKMGKRSKLVHRRCYYCGDTTFSNLQPNSIEGIRTPVIPHPTLSNPIYDQIRGVERASPSCNGASNGIFRSTASGRRFQHHTLKEHTLTVLEFLSRLPFSTFLLVYQLVSTTPRMAVHVVGRGARINNRVPRACILTEHHHKFLRSFIDHVLTLRSSAPFRSLDDLFDFKSHTNSPLPYPKSNQYQ
jgi:hypothetical protein